MPDELLSLPRRPVGRPRAKPGKTLTAWLPATEHDAVIGLARRHRVSVSRFVRLAILVGLLRPGAPR